MLAWLRKITVRGWGAMAKKAPDKPNRDDEKRVIAQPDANLPRRQKMWMVSNFRQSIPLVVGSIAVVSVVVAGVVIARKGGSSPPAQTKCTQTLQSGNGAIGTMDTLVEYTINGGTTWQPAGVINANQAWSAPIAGSQWVSSNVIINGSGPVGYNAVQYRLTFNVPGAPSGFSIKLMSDNWVFVLLNAQQFGAQPVGPVPANFHTPPASYSSNQLVLGSNVIEFQLGNTSNFEGLDFVATATYICPAGTSTPTPSPTATATSGTATTPAPTSTATSAAVSTATSTPCPAGAACASPTASATSAAPTATATPTLSPTSTPTARPSATATATCGPPGAAGACSPTPSRTPTPTTTCVSLPGTSC